jgi:glycerate 2-kinase
MNAQETVRAIFRDTLKAVDPSFLVRGYGVQIKDYMNSRKFKRLLVAGFGKASYHMAAALADEMDEGVISDGVIITKYGHTLSQGPGARGQEPGIGKIKVFEAGHPIPDENGMRATENVRELLRAADERDLVVCLVSGGGSALLVSPYEGIGLKEKQRITDLLMKSGADIVELNAVRKHLSRVKGGRLAELAWPAEVVSLMISDVIGDPLDVIASGPTAPDDSTFQEALDCISKFNLVEKAPKSIMDVLKRGVAGDIPETPKKDNRVFWHVQNIIIGGNRKAIDAARMSARSAGLDVEVLSTELTGEAREAGIRLAGKAKAAKARMHGGAETQRKKTPKCLLSGGETTVVVTGDGKGGRNTELALSFAMEIKGTAGVTLLSAGTDGTDGPTDAAGAVVDGETVARAGAMGLDPREYLDRNDSYNFFKRTDSLLITGPTGTNVMDVQIIIVE